MCTGKKYIKRLIFNGIHVSTICVYIDLKKNIYDIRFFLSFFSILHILYLKLASSLILYYTSYVFFFVRSIFFYKYNKGRRAPLLCTFYAIIIIDRVRHTLGIKSLLLDTNVVTTLLLLWYLLYFFSFKIEFI